jgi:hypothetical protein
MGLKRKQVQLRHKADFERDLQNRLADLSGKGVEGPKADRDPIVRKLKAEIREAKNRLRRIDEHDKRTEEMAKIKADRAAAPAKEKGRDAGKGEKPKKTAEEGKEKKAKGEKKAAAPKSPEGGKGKKAAEAPEEAGTK